MTKKSGTKRAPAAIHSKTSDHRLGRTKDRRHGTESWTTWRETGAHDAGRPSRSTETRLEQETP